MRNEKSKKEKVLDVLRENLYISNIDCINGKHGFVTLRLGALIHELKTENKIKLLETSGYIPHTKNYVYRIEPPKFRMDIRTSNGEIVVKRKIYIPN